MITASRSDIGKIRTVNEDRAFVQRFNGFSLAIVADGMGGHRAGDTASTMTVDLMQSQLQSIHSGMSVEECIDAIKAAVLHANERVFEFASMQEHLHGMGTTIVVALVMPELAVIAHIGDSRAYLLDGQSIRQLTEDHTLVNELIKSGQITAEEASIHPRRNVLTRALGTEISVEVDIQRVEWKEGDLLLLCSDGLSGLVSDEMLLDILLLDGYTLEQKADRLIESALQAGGDDNITVVLLANERSEGIDGGDER